MNTVPSDSNSQINPSPENKPSAVSQSSFPQSEASLPGPVELLKSAWEVYKKRFWVLIGIEAILLVFVLLFVVLTLGTSFAAIILHPSSASLSISSLPILLILIALFIFVGYLANLAMIFAVKDSKERIGVKESFNRAWTIFWPFLWVGILFGLTVLGGFMLFVIPGLIFWVWFNFATLVFVVEGSRGEEALLRSKEYIRGRWGGVFWRLLFILIVPIALSLIIKLVTPYTVESFISPIISMLFWPLSIAYVFSLYSALRDTRSNLAGRSPSGKKGFFVFSAILGVVGIILMVVLMFVVLALSAVVNRGSDLGKNPISDYIREKVLQNLPPIGSITSTTDTINRIGASSTVDTSNWQTYRNEKYGFEFKYPPMLEQSNSPKEDYYAQFYYCDGQLKEVYASDIGHICTGKEYQVGVNVYEEKFDLQNVKKYYDAAPRLPDGSSGIKRYVINGRDFYIGKSSVYTYSGWFAHTAVNDKTVALDFSGNAYILHPNSNVLTDEELSKISEILSTFRFIN